MAPFELDRLDDSARIVGAAAAAALLETGA
jgi:hypothetical protein